MTYLLDVNALVALGFLQPEFHGRVAVWVHKLASEPNAKLATCSITELGFVRVLAHSPQTALTVRQGRDLLLRLRSAKAPQFTFFADDQDISGLPAWARMPRQTTDAHLAQLARAKGCAFATLDRGIPRAFLIP